MISYPQFRAVFLKNLTLELRSVKMLIANLLAMMVFLIVAIALTAAPLPTESFVEEYEGVGRYGYTRYDQFPYDSYWRLPYSTSGPDTSPTEVEALLNSIPTGEAYNYPLNDTDSFPYFYKVDSLDVARKEFEVSFREAGDSSKYDCGAYDREWKMDAACVAYYKTPSGGFDFKKVPANGSLSVDYSLLGWQVPMQSYSDAFFASMALSPYRFMNMIHSAVLRTINGVNDPDTLISGSYTEIRHNVIALDTSRVLGQFSLFALFPPFTIPFFMVRIVLERGNGLMEQSQLAGLSPLAYWSSLLVHDYIIYFCFNTAFLALALAMQFKFVLAGGWTVFVLTYLNGFGVLSFAYCFAVLFKSINKATIWGYLSVIAICAAGWLLNMLIFLPEEQPLFVYMFFPIFAYMRGLYVAAAHALTPDYIVAEVATTAGLVAIGYMLAFSVVFFLFAMYLDQVLPKSEGMRKPFYFPIKALVDLCRGNGGRDESSYLLDPQNGSFANSKDEDLDVTAEKRTVEAMDSSAVALYISGAMKHFPEAGKTFKAVDGVWLGGDDGDCVGLLGPNGAGKSTLVNMICGLLLPTAGEIRVGGFDTAKNPAEAQGVLGLCPQFDILYDDLSVEEHLLYYSRLRGVSAANEEKHIAALVDEVGLQGQRRRYANALSGGQKRRLSIGIALAGTPRIIILDEPSSGLDPGSKRGIWDVIRQVAKTRMVLLTTHSMEEADVLCSRIAIMVNGQLKCIGSQAHLKKKFGSGFKIDVYTKKDEEAKADQFITSVVKGAKKVIDDSGFISYQAPKKTKLSKIFTKIETQKQNFGIYNWGITQANLEEVFLSIVKREEMTVSDDPNVIVTGV